VLLYNSAQAENHWIGLKLNPVRSAPGGVGALIRWSAGGVVRSRSKTGGGSYLSSQDQREILGLGKAAQADWIEVHWPAPSTRVDRISGVPGGKYFTVEEGKRIR
jgi:hypothetical protein